MLHADDNVLIDESSEGVNPILELWRSTIENKGLTIRIKLKYMP